MDVEEVLSLAHFSDLRKKKSKRKRRDIEKKGQKIILEVKACHRVQLPNCGLLSF